MKLRSSATSATLAAVTLLAFLPGTTIGAAAACDPGTRALQYLAANQKADGSLDMKSAGGFGNPVATMNMLIGAAASGYDPSTITSGGNSGYAYLAANSSTATNSIGRAATLVLALTAGNSPAGRFDVDNFGGVHPLSIVQAGYTSSGANAGAFGDGSTFTQTLALLAYRAAGLTPPGASVTWLTNLRNTGRTSGGYTGELGTDTGWSYANQRDTAQADTNTTSEALMALAAAGNHTQDGPALAFLHNQQNPDGGFPLEKPSAFGTSSDADSDSLVLEALKAAGQPLSSWSIGGKTPLSNLLSMQDGNSGGFSGSGPDTFTSSEVPQGIAQVPLPVVAASPSRALPAAGCPQAAATAASPSPTAVPMLPRAGTHPSAAGLDGWLAAALLGLVALGTAGAIARRWCWNGRAR
ncbi:MAG: hypothetical protein ACR2MY_08080 [Candidatus Dormibacteria bacterium]